MKFWQAVVTAQLAAGAVWADRIGTQPLHLIAEAGAVLIGAVAWYSFGKAWGN